VLRLMKEKLDLNGIIANPTTAPIPKPEKISALFAISSGLGKMANLETFPNISKYMMRVADAGFEEFAVLMLHTCVRNHRELYSTPTFTELMTN